METRRNTGQGKGRAAAGGNQVPPQALADGVAIPLSQAGLTEAEVRTALDQMAQAITMQVKVMTSHANR